MTRETKIGLLVGLAFIIVIGILLSDHLTSSTEPPQAPFSSTGPNVMHTIATPSGTQSAQPIVVAPQVQPQQVVPTPRDFRQPTQPAGIVHVDVVPPAAPAPVAIANEPPIKFVAPPSRSAIQATPVDGADAPLTEIARNNGEQLVSVTPSGAEPAQTAAVDPNSREYVAQPGDSLSKITAKVFGTSTKAGQDAIVALNPSLQQNRNMIVAGKTYRVPASVTAAAPAAAPAVLVPLAPAPQLVAVPQKASQTVPAGEVWYTVKPGDTITRIATEELGDETAKEAIIELNHDILPNPDILKVNMKLRLPSKPLAQVN